MTRIRLIKNWRDIWRWYSTHGMALAVALLAAWAALPEKMQDAFSPLELKISAIALILLGLGGRLIDQTKKDAP